MLDRTKGMLHEETAYDGLSALKLPEEIKALNGEIGFKGEVCLIFPASPGEEFLAKCIFEIDVSVGSVTCYYNIQVDSDVRRVRVWVTNGLSVEGWTSPMSAMVQERMAEFIKENPTVVSHGVRNVDIAAPRIGSGNTNPEVSSPTVIDVVHNVSHGMPDITIPSVPPGPLPFESFVPSRAPMIHANTAAPTDVTVSYIPVSNGPSWTRYIDFENKWVLAVWVVGVLLIFAVVVVVRIVSTKTAVPTQSTPRVTPVTWVETDGGQ